MGCGTIQKKENQLRHGSVVLFPGQFVQNLPDSIYTYYEIKESLGSGAYGTVVSAIHKTSRELRAIKIINKFKLHSEESKKKVINEVLILKKLDHPHIIKIFEFNEDEFNLYVVMELCRGGELLDTVVKKRCISENDAALFMKQIISAVYYMHSLGIVHRDLKLENMLLDNNMNKNIKIVDFGTACELEPGKFLSHTIGTINYMAPEMFKKNYNEKCDIWSCGVILYILLSGRAPFKGKDKKLTVASIEKGEYSLETSEWFNISEQAKEFISKLLEPNYNKRISAEEAYNNPWLHTNAQMELNQDYIQRTLRNLTSFGHSSKFQRAVIRYIVEKCLSQRERNDLCSIFKSFDSSGDGKISQAEFVVYCKKVFGTSFSEDEIIMIMNRIDTDKSGFIDYSEFLAAAIDRTKLLSLERLEAAFEAFDRDGNGKITAEELKYMLQSSSELDLTTYKLLIKEVDQNNDEMVDFNEFKAMMNKLK
jgi:calcium-dependent protein kinase